MTKLQTKISWVLFIVHGVTVYIVHNYLLVILHTFIHDCTSVRPVATETKIGLGLGYCSANGSHITLIDVSSEIRIYLKAHTE